MLVLDVKNIAAILKVELENFVIHRNLVLGTLLLLSAIIKADIIKTETLLRGDRAVYLLYDTHVSTPNAKLQAAEIDRALIEMENVKFLVQQVEPITEADKRFSNCLDNLNEIKFLVEADKKYFWGMDLKPPEDRRHADELIDLMKRYNFIILGRYVGILKDDHSYGIASFLDSSDSKKLYINHLKDWIRLSWRFLLNEDSLIKIVKKTDLEKISDEHWQTLITNSSIESFIYQYEKWEDCLDLLSELIKSEKNKKWVSQLNLDVKNRRQRLKNALRTDAEYVEKLNKIKSHDESRKFKFVYPKISDKFIIPAQRTSSNHNDMLMLGVPGGTEAVALLNILDEKTNKKVVLLASSFVCEDVRERLIEEGFLLKCFFGSVIPSFKKITVNIEKVICTGETDSFANSLDSKRSYVEWTRAISPELCTPFKD